MGGPARSDELRVLVVSKTGGFRHDSIERGVALIQSLGANHGFVVDATEDGRAITPRRLAPYRAVVFLNTTGDVLNPAQQKALENYVRRGGGWVGVHSAADTEHDWPFYGTLLGGDAWFLTHPAIQTAGVVVERANHPSTRHFPAGFSFTDEWYAFLHNPRPSVRVLLTLDEATYDPGSAPMGDHPIAWCHTVGRGRSWYTNLGHRVETYDDPGFAAHLLGGIRWVTAVRR
jgi:type 1 glutamine amidotransferase